jgi:hypothetical protein
MFHFFRNGDKIRHKQTATFFDPFSASVRPFRMYNLAESKTPNNYTSCLFSGN